MSTESDGSQVDADLEDAGIPELSVMGRRIELRRLERRLTKRQLAQRAGISRQQLWRVMTGKADVTVALGARLAQVLEVDSRWLDASTAVESSSMGSATVSWLTRSDERTPLGSTSAPPTTWATFLADAAALERAVAALPSDAYGRRLKRALLNAVEDVASDAGTPLPEHFFDLRRRVVNAEP